MVCPVTGFSRATLTSRNKTFAYFLQVILPHLPELFPAAIVQKAAFGPSAYLVGNDESDKTGTEMERREAEVWGLAAALAVNAPEDQQTNLVAALREKVRRCAVGMRHCADARFCTRSNLRERRASCRRRRSSSCGTSTCS